MNRIVAVGIAALLAVLIAVPMATAGGNKPLQPGTVAPELKADGWLNGDAPKMDALKGKVWMAEFFATW